jgi:hypothetical protein
VHLALSRRVPGGGQAKSYNFGVNLSAKWLTADGAGEGVFGDACWHHYEDHAKSKSRGNTGSDVLRLRKSEIANPGYHYPPIFVLFLQDERGAKIAAV